MKFSKQNILPWLTPSKYSASTKNWLKGMTALGLLASGTGSLAFLAGGISAFYTTLAFNAAITFTTAWYSKEIVFWLYSIKPIKEGELVEGFDLHKMVHEIAFHPNIACSMPDLGIYETDKLNAFATGRHTGHAGVAVTRGLLKAANNYAAKKPKYSAEELVKAVLFHELGHVSHHDVAIQSAISILALLFTKVCHSAYDKVFNTPLVKTTEKAENKNKSKKENKPNLFSPLLLASVFVLGWTGSIISKLLTRWFSRTRETCADETAFQCGYGPQLAVALKMLEEGSKTAPRGGVDPKNNFFGDNSIDDALFCHHHAHEKNDKKKGVITWAFEAFSSHPATEDRIKHLDALEDEKNAPRVQLV